MAKKLSPEELERQKTDFDPPAIAKRDDRQKPDKTEKKHTGKGNPNGRPPSIDPRTKMVAFKLSAAERERLDEAARILETTKTKIVVEGIELVYARALREERQRERANKEGGAE